MVDNYGNDTDKLADWDKNLSEQAGFVQKAILRSRVVASFIIFNLFMSAIGIFTTITAAKINQYDNPLLFALPLSTVLWVFLIVFVKTPREKYTEEN